MYPYYTGIKRQLDNDDCLAVWDLYGYPFSISGPSSACGQATYTVENLPSGANVRWSTSSNIRLISQAANGASAVFQGEGWGWIYADIYMQSELITRLSKEVYLRSDFLPSPDISCSGGEELNPNSSYTLYAWGCNADSYTWTAMGDAELSYNGAQNYEFTTPYPSITLLTGSGYPGMGSIIRVRCVAHNGCTSSRAGILKLYFSSPGGFLPITPNPVRDILHIRWNEEEQPASAASFGNKSKQKTGYEIQIWRGTHCIKTLTSSNPEISISTEGWPKGFYFVRLIKDGRIYSQKFNKE